MMNSPLARSLAAFGTLALLAACGGDEDPSYSVELTVSNSTVSANGSNAVVISVSVTDDGSGRPAPPGGEVFIQCQDSGGAASGTLGTSDQEGQGSAFLDSAGIAAVPFRCSRDSTTDYTIQCIALYDGESGFLLPFTCRGTTPAED